MNRRTYDPFIYVSAASLIGLGLVMVTSASLSYAEGRSLHALYFATRHAIYLGLGAFFCWLMSYIPLAFWRKLSGPILILCFITLSLVLIPGFSHPVNGSRRWLFLGPISLQFSEFVKLGLIIYLSGYLVRHNTEVQNKISGFLKPTLILSIIGGLLLLEPDFGAAVVIIMTAMGMLFLGGVPLRRFLLLLLLAVVALGALSVISPYRIVRLTAFLNPWEDQFNTGYQLTQSLIAFGRGGFWGVGLGNNIQKLLYLPEPHTDFLYAVVAEELGLMGAVIVLLLMSILVVRALRLGNQAVKVSQFFAGYLAYGIALWFGIQTIINIGVNIGVLPTKGLTLPMMSYGGNSVLVTLVALGLLLRIDFEQQFRRYEFK